MKRSARCIQMLMLLKARGFMTREELAEELQTNIRNVGEYRKELEEAGFNIVSSTGKYGGYQLDTSCLFPVIGLTKEESQALFESIDYMKSHGDFLLLPQYIHAMDKFLATNKMKHDDAGIYVTGDKAMINPILKQYIQTMTLAKERHVAVDFMYKSMHATTYEKIRVHPYECLNVKGSHYCLAYSLKAKDYRFYKFSEERMKHVQMTNLSFTRDPDFRASKYLGVKGLMGKELYDIDVIFHDESALFVSEQEIGVNPKGEWLDDHRYRLKTIMEGKLTTIHFLMGYGDQCEILEPKEIYEEMKQIVKHMYEQYHLK